MGDGQRQGKANYAKCHSLPQHGIMHTKMTQKRTDGHAGHSKAVWAS